ncbi:glutaredoxin family protein [Nitrospina watsonii]|uniref:Glutaredoxin n=1 Tax=Nitrospina watsonii TaxID=1323948 RepID=A0ABM9HG59_9BACT|nr:glutathione S-transferase N-terminal domain-containing protein [Nitrospina watsonii]CAI2719252.1 Glutaredoxin [Nitrospina watsonii]
MIKFYSVYGCGYCTMVQSALEQLDLDYETIMVPAPHQQRQEVKELTGQTFVPVLVDGDVILHDEYEIIRYLKSTYSSNSN